MAEWNPQANDIFVRAAEIDAPVERRLFVEQQCGGDAALRAQVESLLAAGGKVGSFLERPAVPAPPPDGGTAAYGPVTEGPGTVVGPYKLLQHIGEGGFGAVYMAEQEHPVRRKVALKIIKLGMDTREVVARFEAERQALAMMDHPNIARVFDAGATDSGRPYFVMELVRGVPITEFCDRNKLPAAERLRLFVTVCHAIQHAHHKGVIHRDIKPSNVMVTLHDGVPVPKVIDFGVAKATAQRLTERTLFTAYGQMIGTPAYMSPEQAEMSGLDIDTRSDIFSLGVLLYELLTGTTPLDAARLRTAGYAEMQRLIREEEAPRPSTRFSSLGGEATVLATNRGTDAKRLSQLLRSDLDWVVMKALEKDRNRRYGSPDNFAADVERYLAEQPVDARPPSAWYRFRKAARRNRAALTTAALVAAALIVGTAASAWQAVRATAAEAAARASEAAAVDQAQAANAGRALAAQESARAEQERDAAEAARADLRRTLYAAEMNLVQSAWTASDLPAVLATLDRQRPKPGEPDLRGFEWHYWDRKCHAELAEMTLPLRLAPPTAISPDGRFVATVAGAGQGATLKLLDAAMGRVLSSTPIPEESRPGWMAKGPTRLAFSPSGTRLLVLWPRGRLMVRSVPDDRVLLDKRGFFRDDAAAVSDSHVAVALADDDTRDAGFRTALAVLRIDDGTEAFRRPAPFNPRDAAFSGDGRRLAVTTSSAGDDRLQRFQLGQPLPRYAVTAHVFDAGTGEEVGTIPNLPTFFRALALNRNGTRLAGWRSQSALSSDGEPDGGVWDTKTGQRLTSVDGVRYTHMLESAAHPPPHVAFSPDDTRLLWYSPSAEGHPRVSVRDAATGSEIVGYDSVAGIDAAAAFAADGARVRTVGYTGVVKDWPVPPPEPEREKMPIFVAADPAGRRLLVRQRTGPRDGFKVIASLQLVRPDGEVLTRFDDPARTAGRMFAAFGPDGGSVATAEDSDLGVGGSRNGPLVCAWDAATGKKRWEQAAPGAPAAIDYTSDGRWLGVLVSRTGKSVMTYRIATFDAGSGSPGPTFDAPAAHITRGGSDASRIPFSHDGRRVAVLAAAADKDAIAVRELASGREVRTFDGPAGFRATAIEYSPDGRRVAAGFTSATVPRGAFGAPPRIPENLTGRLVVWEVGSGQEVCSATFTYGPVRSLTFSPDGDRLAVTYWKPGPDTGGTVEVSVYDVGRGAEWFRLCTGVPAPFALAFDPAGRRIATVTEAPANPRGVKVWDADTGRELLTLPSVLHGSAIRFTADGARLIVWGSRSVYAGLPQIWDATPRPEPNRP
ncbi:MAG: serine/threonine-protein kinase [Gemmataceae bacterium]